jgi:hypothetical protein
MVATWRPVRAHARPAAAVGRLGASGAVARTWANVVAVAAPSAFVADGADQADLAV